MKHIYYVKCMTTNIWHEYKVYIIYVIYIQKKDLFIFFISRIINNVNNVTTNKSQVIEMKMYSTITALVMAFKI